MLNHIVHVGSMADYFDMWSWWINT